MNVEFAPLLLQSFLALVFILWNIMKSTRRFRFVPFLMYAGILINHFSENKIPYAAVHVIVMMMYVNWMNYHSKLSRIFTTGVIAASATLLVGLGTFFLPESRFLTIFFNIGASFCFLLFILRMYTRLFDEKENVGLVIRYTKMLLTLQYLLIFPMSIFIASGNPLFQLFLAPGTIIIHFFISLRLEQEENLTNKHQTEFTIENYANIFNFMNDINLIIAQQVTKKQLGLNPILEYLITKIGEAIRADASALLIVDHNESYFHVQNVYGEFPILHPMKKEDMKKMGVMQLFGIKPGSEKNMHRNEIEVLHDYLKSTPIKFENTFLADMTKTLKPIHIHDSAHEKIQDPRILPLLKNGLTYFSSMIAYPVIVSNNLYGIFCLVNTNRNHLFADQDFERTTTYIDYTSLAIESLVNYNFAVEVQEIKREMEIAGEIQRQLFPTLTLSDSAPSPKKIGHDKSKGNENISIYFNPFQGVSGDYHDVITLNETTTGLLICDVAGKGVPASMVMIMIRTLFHSYAPSSKSTAQLMQFINQNIAGKLAIDNFATMSYMTLDTTTGHLQFTNAAHLPTIIYRKETNTFEQIDTPGLPIGVNADMTYEMNKYTIADGDIIVMYTDGITEIHTKNNDLYGESRIFKLVKEHGATSDASSLREIILEDIVKICGEINHETQSDDMTLIIWKPTIQPKSKKRKTTKAAAKKTAARGTKKT